MPPFEKRPALLSQNPHRAPVWLWALGALLFLAIILVCFLPAAKNSTTPPASTPKPSSSSATGPRPTKPPLHSLAESRRHRAESAVAAQQIVAAKLKAFNASRRKLANALAQRHGVAMPDSVKRFFDAIDKGNWDEIRAAYKAINSGDGSATTIAGRPPDIQALWPVIVDAYGAAEQAHAWPARQLLDYGNAIMNSLSPGAIYVGGTDDGRWVPELMNADSDSPHIMLTQNGLADPGYRDYLNLQYADQLTTLTADDGSHAMQDYLADYQKRLAHDQQFPDQPPQVRPNESQGISAGSDGQLTITGPNAQVAVMSVNENLLTTLMNENPQLSFALQESFPLKSTYADALPQGPIMQLGATDAQTAFTPDLAAQSVSYWNNANQQLLSDPDAADSEITLKVYAKDETAAANLLAAHGYTDEASQIYQTAVQLAPSSPYALGDYVNFLLAQNQADQAIAIAQKAQQANPDNPQFQNILNQAKGSHPH